MISQKISKKCKQSTSVGGPLNDRVEYPAKLPSKQFIFCKTTHAMQLTAVSVHYIIIAELVTNNNY